MTNTRLTRRTDVITLILPDGYVMLYLASTDWAYTLTPLGGLVWEFCDGTNTLEDIVRRIGAVEGVTPLPDLKDRVAEFAAELEKVALLVGD